MKVDIEYMIIAAHPDDIEFGCGGSVALWREKGIGVAYVLSTSGDKGSSDPEVIPEQLAKRREEEQLAAAESLGVSDVEFMRYPDQGVEESAQMRKEIVRLMRSYRPRVVITMDPYKKYIWHRDHRVTGQVVLDAVFPFVRDPLAYPDLLEQGYLPHKVEEIWFFGSEDINHRMDISRTFSKKIAALYHHVSQMEQMGYENVEKWVKKKCIEAAKGESFEYGEGFHREIIPS